MFEYVVEVTPVLINKLPNVVVDQRHDILYFVASMLLSRSSTVSDDNDIGFR